MATVSIYYDQRYKSASGKYPLYYRVNLPRRKNFVINTGLTIPPEWWDGYEIIKAPQREKMNRALRRGLNNIEDALLEVQLTHGLNGKAADIKARIIAHMNGVEYVAPEAVGAERVYETMEGTARYIEFHACPGGYDLDANDWLYRTDISQYMYATGFNIVRLLDKLGVDCKTRLFDEGLALDGLLPE